MTIHLKLFLLFAIIAVACGGLSFSSAVRAQPVTFAEAPATPEPDANKKEGTYGATNPSPTPTPPPKK
jgi:hypothetical protein